MSDKAPLVYIIFGAQGAGRREVIFDLIEGGVDTTTAVLYFRSDSEPACPFDEQIEALENVSVVTWKLDGAKATHGKISAAPENILFLAPGNGNPADVAEAVKTWTDHNHCEIGRIITVVHCALLSENPGAQAWYDACIHFSDMVLLNRRENVNNKLVKALEDRFTKERYPCRFALVKKGRVANPAEVLEPEARRLSLYFDELIPIEDDEFDDEEKPKDTQPDKYIERLESGHRAYPIPDIQKYLQKE
jgi:hypothetical protein